MTTISVPLNLPQVNVTKILTNQGDLTVFVESTESETSCKDCGKQITQYHRLNKTITLNHLSAFGKPVYIKFQPIRYECTDCPSTTTQTPTGYHSIGHCTQLYAEYMLDLFVNSTLQDVARQENISYKRIINIIKQHIPKKIEGRIVVLGILKNRKKKTVKEFLLSIPRDLSKRVKNVCSDMYDGFINAAKEVFGTKITIVIDRFHVAKNDRGAIETLRKKEMRRLKKELSEEEYKKLKNIMWILRKKETLNLFFKYSPLMKKAYKFRNKLTEILDPLISQKQAKRKIKQWIKNIEKSELTCFGTFIKTPEFV